MARTAPTYPTPPSAIEPVEVSLRALEILVRVLLAYAAVMAWFAVPVLALRSLAPESPSLPWMAGGVVSLSALLLLWMLRGRVASGFAGVATALAGIPPRTWIAFCLATGLLLRLAWVAAFPGVPASDGVIYISLARKLIAGEPYAMAKTLAYWPPGYPLFLAPWLAGISDQRIAIAAANLVLFVVGALGVWTLGRRVSNDASARMALLLFAVWPNLVFQAGLPEKEQVLVALLPWIVALGVVKGPVRMSFTKLLLGGLLLGMAILVQPALLLFPFALLCYWLACNRNPAASLRMLAVTALGMAIVIAPWTLRNYRVLDQFVLVSTNGGFGIYGANNPQATGGYLEHWPADLMRMPELEADREARRRAVEWIVANPARFLALAFEKNIRFMGDDSVGAYQTLRRGDGSRSGPIYTAAKTVANLFWLAIWALLLSGLLAGARGRERNAPETLIVPFAFIYFLLLHSIFESNGKYHVLTIGILSVLVPMILTSIPRPKVMSPDR